jgi:hypothetical protein
MTTIRRLRQAWQALADRVRPVRDPDAHLDDADAEFWHPGPGDDTAPLLPVVPPPAPAWDSPADTEAVPVLSARPIGPRHAGHRPDPLTDIDHRPEILWAQTPIFAGVLLDAGLIALPAGEPEAASDVTAAIDRLLEADRRLEEATGALVEETAKLTAGLAVGVAR